MSTHSAPDVGRVVWHDLVTNDVGAATRFYADLFGWTYQIEHAERFAWTSGEADYPLIVASGVAHGGVVDLGTDVASHWLAYIQVPDVNDAVASAQEFGGSVDRAPFDVPGVGQSAVIRDRQGAAIAVHTPTHTFPPPEGVFHLDELLTHAQHSAEEFYAALIGWRAITAETDYQHAEFVFQRADGMQVARGAERSSALSALWVPTISVTDVEASVDRALALGAELQAMSEAARGGTYAILSDPTGAKYSVRIRPTRGEPDT